MSVVDFIIRGKQKHDEKINDYNSWAFPYGFKQKNIISNILRELLPNENVQIANYNYLICKQELAKSDGSKYKIDLDFMKIHELNKKFNFKNIDNLYRCIVLVEADSKIDEKLDYPSIVELNNRAKQIKEILD